MDRRAAIATALAVVLGVGAAVFAVESNLGVPGNRTNVGKLTLSSSVAPRKATAKATPKPKVITVYVTPTAAVRPAQPSVQYVDTTITVPARTTTSGGGSAPRSGGNDDGNERDD